MYLSGRLWDKRLPDDNKTEISVLGLRRGRKYYVGSAPIVLIENLRLTRVYSPRVGTFKFAPSSDEEGGHSPEEEKNQKVCTIYRNLVQTASFSIPHL